MPQSFYNFLIDNVLADFFKSHIAKRGEHYSIIIENNDNRQSFIDAIKTSIHARPLVVKDIYEGAKPDYVLDQYETYEFDADDNGISVPFIIADYDSGKEYLPTIRNAVNVNRPYSNYATLFILSDYSVLETLATAVINLEDVGQAFNAVEISRYINEWVTKQSTLSSYELKYLRAYLSRLTDQISEDSSDLFDFENVMEVLGANTLDGLFDKLSYFSDEAIYSVTGVQDIEKRIKENAEYYDIISRVMSNLDEDAREEDLSKYFEPKLIQKIVKDPENWHAIDFSTVRESANAKKSKSALVVENVQFMTKDGVEIKPVDYIGNKPEQKKKTKNAYIICREDGVVRVKITFNKSIKDLIIDCPEGKKVFDKSIQFDLEDNVVNVEVGKDSNIHELTFTKIDVHKDAFGDFIEYIKLKTKGDIVVNVPEDRDEVKLGIGENPMSPGAEIDWLPEYSMLFRCSDANDGKLSQVVRFSGKKVKFQIVFDNNKVAPKTPFEIFEMIWRDGVSFRDARRAETYSVVSNGVLEVSSTKEFRTLLQWEDRFVKENVLAYSKDEYGNYLPVELNLPESVASSLNAIYKYYRDKALIPSLANLDDEIIGLYKNYLQAVNEVVTNIETGETLSAEEYALTKVGTIKQDENQTWLSPFHPTLVSFALEFASRFDNKDYQSNVLRLISPHYLLPYISVDDQIMAPCIDDFTEKLKTWLIYEPIGKNSHDRAFNITSKSVCNKLKSFVSQFEYLFTDDECPILINTFGTTDDTNVIKGVIDFIIDQLKNNKKQQVHKIEIHEYVDDLLKETFFEKLNRLNSDDAIKRCLESVSIKATDKEYYTIHELVRCIFSKIAFYKHRFSPGNYTNIKYSHITFFQMSTGKEIGRIKTSKLRSELSLNGLISIPATYCDGLNYRVGFGTKGEQGEDYISGTAKSMNSLYAYEARGGKENPFVDGTCITKDYCFDKKDLLAAIYQSSNWVTFLNPEVDLEFFYKQDLYIVHYTDQYTINAKYDSITVTKHVDRYKSLILNTFNQGGLLDSSDADKVAKVLLDYFNCLNGQWLLNISKQTDFQVREKLSIVATILAMKSFLGRNESIIWIPISLDEILRVTGAIGLPKDYLFTKDALKANGKPISDDLLMMGVDVSEVTPKVYLYPIEIKYSQDDIHSEKGGIQVANTYKLFAERLYGDLNFVRSVYRVFFASQLLTNLDKMKANGMISDTSYKAIEAIRAKLLNADFEIETGLPIKQMGAASLVTFNSGPNMVETEIVENVPLCHININTPNCLNLLKDTADELNELLMSNISASEDFMSALGELHEMINQELADPFMGEDLDSDDVDESEIQPAVIEPLEPVASVEPSSEAIVVASPVVNEDASVNIEDNNKETDKVATGISLLVGNNKFGNQPVYFYPNNTRCVSHPNLGIIGTMGTGKTQFARSVIAQFSKESCNNVNGTPIGMLVFDYKGDYNDSEFLSMVGGHCYKANYPFNPLKLCVTEDMKFMNLPSITANRVADSISKAFGLGNVQASTILEAILDAYDEAGITRDPSTWERPAPTMQRVVDKYLEGDVKKDTVYSVFRMLQDYQIFTNDTNNCVTMFEWLKSVQVIDLTLYEDNIKKLIVSLVLDVFYAEMKQLKGSDQKDGFREIRTMILVDEAHQFMKMKFNSLRKIISEGRMFGVGMILSTQGMSDFKTDEDYSTFIKSWVVHNVTNPTKSDLASIFGASDPNLERYMAYITNAVTFQSICKLGNQVNYIEDVPYFKLIESDERFR